MRWQIMSWGAPPVCPFQIVSSQEEAEGFLEAELKALAERKLMKEEKRVRRKLHRQESLKVFS